MAETRVRRGKVITIPEEWRGVFPTAKTMRGRQTARVEVRASRKRRLRAERNFDYSTQLTE